MMSLINKDMVNIKNYLIIDLNQVIKSDFRIKSKRNKEERLWQR